MLNYLTSLPGAVAQGLICGILAIGVYITYKILDFADLTVDGSFCTGAAVCAALVTRGVNIWLAMLAAVAAGMLAGLVTGLFHTLLGIPPILSGILTQLMLWSVNLKVMGKAVLSMPERNYDVLVAQIDREKSILILLGFIAVLVAVLYWFFGTELGSSIRATGCNQSMSRAQGINTGRMKVLALVLSNGIVALAGTLRAQYLGNAEINMGKGAIVTGLAAVIIGGAVFSRITKNFAAKLGAVAAGGIIYQLVYQTVIYLGFDTDLLQLLSALVVAIFLAVPYWNGKLRGKFGRKKQEGGDGHA